MIVSAYSLWGKLRSGKPVKPCRLAASAQQILRLCFVAGGRGPLTPTHGSTNTNIVDPLPSWRDGATKAAILDFVASVTDRNSADYVPPAARIATFDNDGTLWSEHPLIQGLFIMTRAKVMVAANPALGEEEVFQRALA